MKAKDIRRKFLEFFKSKKHEVVPSDSLVPKADPTLLFTSAGMNRFKEQFLGHNVAYKRACSSQKCLRTADLDKVGKTPSHHTFFEMLGNFSFGDYFKKEAIEWAWEFMTKVLGIKEEKLWVSVYAEDDESYKIWRDVIKIPVKKIVELGAKENFWPSDAPKEGPNGPCGPCTEIFYDWGEKTGCGKKTCNPSCDCGRFMEVWNLVFTQFDRKDGGKLDSLPNKNIDTGMGLERIASVMQGVKTNFETDLFAPIIEGIKKYCPAVKTRDANTIADHIRAAAFAIADGVAPSNEERGYVIRKLIRRAYIRSGQDKPFLYNIVPRVAEITRDVYPELVTKREEISLIVKEEEERFGHTLSLAMPILNEGLAAAKGKILSGEKIFKLVDTYGLPFEVIENKAKKSKVKIDIKAYERLMEERKAISRKKSKLADNIFSLDVFKQYAPEGIPFSNDIPLKARIAFMTTMQGRDDIGGAEVIATRANEGDIVRIITNPQSDNCYTEAGGQVGDAGTIKGENGTVKITNTRKEDNRVFHIGKVVDGSIAEGDLVTVEINTQRKQDIAKNHTATHLLHSALREVLGEHVHQAGSLVEENRLRFDFTHMKKLTDREIERVERLVNERIKKATPVRKEEKSLEEAKAEGAIALFVDKYQDRVRVVSVGEFSKEVCGGTHVENTKDIGLFKIIRESSVASGIRRIEAVTAGKAKVWMEESEKRKAKSEKALKRKEEEKKLAREKLKAAVTEADPVIKKAEIVKGTKIIAEEIKGADIGILRKLCDAIKLKEKSLFIALAGERDGKAGLVLSISKDLVSRGLDASRIIKEIAKPINGSGGGRPDFGQAGGKNPSGLSEALSLAKKIAKDKVRG